MAGQITFVFADWNSSTTGYFYFGYNSETFQVNATLSGGPGGITNFNAPAGSGDLVGLSPSTTYTVTVTANPNSTPPGSSMSSSFTTPAGATPGNVTSLSASASSQTTGSASYSYTSSTTGVSITISGNGVPSVTSNNFPGGSATFGNLEPGGSYTVFATASPSGNTRSASFSTPSPIAVPPTVTGFSATPSYPPPSVHLNWSAASGATSYEVHYGKSDGTFDAVISVGGTSTNISVEKSKTYYFYVYGVNSSGRSSQPSTILNAMAGPPRPSNFAWAFTTVSAGQPCGMDHRDWNALAAKVNSFREYYPGATLSAYGFTTAVAGTFPAFMYRQAVTAISDMSPPTSVPPLHFTGDVVTAANIDRLRLSLNSIP